MITGEQIRAARGLFGLSGRELAEISGVSYPTIQRIEAQGTARSAVATVEAIKAALEGQGVQFLGPGAAAAGVGVALRSCD